MHSGGFIGVHAMVVQSLNLSQSDSAIAMLRRSFGGCLRRCLVDSDLRRDSREPFKRVISERNEFEFWITSISSDCLEIASALNFDALTIPEITDNVAPQDRSDLCRCLGEVK